MKKKILSMLLVLVMMVNLVPLMGVNASAVTSEELTAANTASVKTLKDGVTYFITQDLTINASKSNKNGLVVDNGATVTLSIPYSTTLTVYGKNGSGTTGGGAAILLPNGATLKIIGNGKIVAVGGKAGNGSTGGSGSRSIANDNTNGHYKSEFGSNAVYFAGAGGTGGNGGGGAGAGIGTNGGSGGYGSGSGGSGWRDDGIVDSNRNGYGGSAGASGSSASAAGKLICAATIDMTGVVGGSAGSAGSSGSRGSNGYDGDEGDARGIAGGAGGGGGGGGLAGAAVGTGGGGGGQGGGGGSAGYIWGGRYVGGGGGGGGQGAGTSGGGAYGSDGAIPEYDCENVRVDSVTVHRWSSSGGSGSLSSYGSSGNGADMTIESRSGKNYRGTAGSGGRGGYSGATAVAYKANDNSGKYINTYTITWIVDGVTTTEDYEHGKTPAFKGSTDKAEDAVYTYTFAGWDNEIVPATSAATYTATYNCSLRTYGASVGESLHGSVTLAPPSALVGDTITVTIAPNEGYEVDAVTATGTVATKIAENEYTFPLPASDVVVDVTYKKIVYNVALFNGGKATGGNYSVNMASATIGDSVTIAVAPNLGYLVDTVTVNGVAAINNGDGTYSFTMPAQAVSISVVFDIDLPAIASELQKLNDADDVLQTAIEGGDDDLSAEIAALSAAFANLQNIVNNLDNDYATDAQLNMLKTTLDAADATMSTAIAALTTCVQNLEADLAAANDKINTNASDITTLKSDVATLNTWKTQAQSTITALQTLTEIQGTDISKLKVAVQNLEAEIAATKARIDDLEDRIDALEGKVSSLEIAKQNLDAAVAALNAAITNKADTATLNQKVSELNTAIGVAEAAAKAYADEKDTVLKTELTAAIATAKSEAITTAENLVNTAKAELQTAIDSKADISTLNIKVSELNTAIATAEATAKAYTDSAVTTLNATIITAKDEAVDVAKNLVDAAKAELQAAIDNKADATTVNAAIANLQNAITALQNTKDNYIAADAALKAELEEKIAKAKQEAIDAAKGYIPYIGENGNWWIGDTDTGVDANGIKGDTGNGIASITTKKENDVTTITITFTDTTKQPVVFTISDGEKGDIGVDGVGIAKIEKTASDGNVDTYTITLTNGQTFTFTVTNGKDGLTPFIGENGNWWIGDTDTGVKATADNSVPAGSNNVTEAEGVDTVTVVAIAIAGIALLGNVFLAILVLKKKKFLI